MTTVAVAGGGIAGCLIALGLAEAGCRVDLFERDDELMAGASFWCEGKIHLGFVYSLDASLRTGRAMAAGAATFVPLLSRWMPSADLASSTSKPFLYAVPSESLVGPATLERYFDALPGLWRDAVARTCVPAGTVAPTWRRITPRELSDVFDVGRIQAAYDVNEVAIDPMVIARGLREAVSAQSRITVHLASRVTRIVSSGGPGMGVAWEEGEQRPSRVFDFAVNATWFDRLRLDADAGHPAGRPVIHRYKVGLHGSRLPADVPSVTYVIGEFGDVVNFPDRSYFSWYPVGLLGTSHDLAPGVTPTLTEQQQDRIRTGSLRALADLMPSMGSAIEAAGSESAVEGGWISAWGQTGITDPRSELHRRFEIGPTRFGRYVTVDTGKYTTAPLFAHQAVELVLGHA